MLLIPSKDPWISVPEKLLTILNTRSLTMERQMLTIDESDGVLVAAHFPSSPHQRALPIPFPLLISNEENPETTRGSSRRTWTRMGVHYTSISPASFIVKRRKLGRNKLA